MHALPLPMHAIKLVTEPANNELWLTEMQSACLKGDRQSASFLLFKPLCIDSCSTLRHVLTHQRLSCLDCIAFTH